MNGPDLAALLARHARVRLAHLPTPIDPMPNLSRSCGGAALFVKRDDCTGIALGGNKVRQLEFYLGDALARSADTVLITGAVQSNYVRATAAMANRLGLRCHIQLEDRTGRDDVLYRSSGNVLLDKLLGATLHYYPKGEDEAGADAHLHEIAARLRAEGAMPYVIPLAPGNPPLGALGYVCAAAEIVDQVCSAEQDVEQLFVASGSALTHAGLLWGLRALGSAWRVAGICVRRKAPDQKERVMEKLSGLDDLTGHTLGLGAGDVDVRDAVLAPGYGKLNEETRGAMSSAARHEGLVLDPVYTGKAMAGMLHALRTDTDLSGAGTLFVHTGGQPALFAYGDDVLAERD